MQLFVDMDGVLADFDRHYLEVFGKPPAKRLAFDQDGHDIDWEAVRKRGNFYLDMPPMADMEELWGFVERLKPAPIVLTGIPSSVTEAADNKRAWVRKNLGPDVEVRCCRSKEKYLHAQRGDILIDDWEKYKHLWQNAGGLWITHRSAEATIDELLTLGWGL
jgi:hypothetical protein